MVNQAYPHSLAMALLGPLNVDPLDPLGPLDLLDPLDPLVLQVLTVGKEVEDQACDPQVPYPSFEDHLNGQNNVNHSQLF